MLFRIWQHALMEQPMLIQELWHWVHECYGQELGFTSDDEDFDNTTLGDKVSSTTAPGLLCEESSQSFCKQIEVAKEMPGELSQTTSPVVNSQKNLSDTSESDEDNNQGPPDNRVVVDATYCPVNHEGKLLLSETLPVPIDDLFTLIFTDNSFNRGIMQEMKYTDVRIQSWAESPETGLKMRVINLTVPVHQPVGPKTCRVTETQVMQSCSKPGELYVIEVEVVNAGVPYCDSFHIATHYCLTRNSATEATFNVYCQIKYRKSVWGFVKGFIEKNVWAGLDDFYKAFRQALVDECGKKEAKGEVEEVKIEERENTSLTASSPKLEEISVLNTSTVMTANSNSNDTLVWIIIGVLTLLVFLNVVLYYKLSYFEDLDRTSRLSTIIDSQILSKERSHEEWVSLLQKQAIQHQREVEQWKSALKSVISLLKQAEDSISSLQNSIHSAGDRSVVEALKSLLDLEDTGSINKRNEL